MSGRGAESAQDNRGTGGRKSGERKSGGRKSGERKSGERKSGGRKSGGRKFDPGAAMVEVATRLRSGATVAAAWEKTLRAHGFTGADVILDDQGVPGVLTRLASAGAWERRQAGITKLAASSLPAVIAACRLGHRSGAPLADVLDQCAEGIIESTEAVSAREVAMAGPETSAYMLAYLPLVGLAFGYLIGVDPFSFFTSSLVGRLVLLAGLGIEVVGVVWTRRMIAAARKEDDDA